MVCQEFSDRATQPRRTVCSHPKTSSTSTRDFVCVRLDSYESETHQKYVRAFLDGRFENSVFCLLAPDGQKWLTAANRGPEMVLDRRSAAQQMNQYAFWYPATAEPREAIVQDFHSFRQALNVASADQRVLVLVNAPSEHEQNLRESLAQCRQ